MLNKPKKFKILIIFGISIIAFIAILLLTLFIIRNRRMLTPPVATSTPTQTTTVIKASPTVRQIKTSPISTSCAKKAAVYKTGDRVEVEKGSHVYCTISSIQTSISPAKSTNNITLTVKIENYDYSQINVPVLTIFSDDGDGYISKPSLSSMSEKSIKSMGSIDVKYGFEVPVAKKNLQLEIVFPYVKELGVRSYFYGGSLVRIDLNINKQSPAKIKTYKIGEKAEYSNCTHIVNSIKKDSLMEDSDFIAANITIDNKSNDAKIYPRHYFRILDSDGYRDSGDILMKDNYKDTPINRILKNDKFTGPVVFGEFAIGSHYSEKKNLKLEIIVPESAEKVHTLVFNLDGK